MPLAGKFVRKGAHSVGSPQEGHARLDGTSAGDKRLAGGKTLRGRVVSPPRTQLGLMVLLASREWRL